MFISMRTRSSIIDFGDFSAISIQGFYCFGSTMCGGHSINFDRSIRYPSFCYIGHDKNGILLLNKYLGVQCAISFEAHF